jgi:hypothetical protein
MVYFRNNLYIPNFRSLATSSHPRLLIRSAHSIISLRWYSPGTSVYFDALLLLLVLLLRPPNQLFNLSLVPLVAVLALAIAREGLGDEEDGVGDGLAGGDVVEVCGAGVTRRVGCCVAEVNVLVSEMAVAVECGGVCGEVMDVSGVEALVVFSRHDDIWPETLVMAPSGVAVVLVLLAEDWP